MTPRGCSEKEERFCLLYIANGRKGAAAARDAGFAPGRAKVTASELLKTPRIQERIAALTAAAVHSALEAHGVTPTPASPSAVTTVTPVTPGVTAEAPGAPTVAPAAPPSPVAFVSQEKVAYLREAIVDELAHVGLSRFTDLATWGPDGVEFTESGKLSERAAASVAGVESKMDEVITNEGDKILRRTTLKIRQHGKVPALGALAELLDMKPKKEAPAAGAGGGVTVIVAGGATGLELAARAIAPAAAPRAVAIVSAPEL